MWNIRTSFWGPLSRRTKLRIFWHFRLQSPANETDASFSELSHSGVSQGMAHNDNNIKQMGTDSTVYCYFDQ